MDKLKSTIKLTKSLLAQRDRDPQAIKITQELDINLENQDAQENQNDFEIPAEVQITADRLFRIPVF